MEINWPKKRSVGSWAAPHPQWGTGNVSYLDSISPEFFEKKQAIFKRAWLNVGQFEQLPRWAAISPRRCPGVSTWKLLLSLPSLGPSTQ